MANSWTCSDKRTSPADFRQASNSGDIQPRLGPLDHERQSLLAIRHDSSRFTRDLDFSTTEQYRADMADQLLDEFEK